MEMVLLRTVRVVPVSPALVVVVVVLVLESGRIVESGRVLESWSGGACGWTRCTCPRCTPPAAAFVMASIRKRDPIWPRDPSQLEHGAGNDALLHHAR